MNVVDRENPNSSIPQLEKKINGLVGKIYPVGCVFFTSSDKYDPNKELTGRWEKVSSSPYHEWHRIS